MSFARPIVLGYEPYGLLSCGKIFTELVTTITIQKCKQAATQNGWDNNQEQECANLICTHPGNNATCSREGVVVTPTPTKRTCEQCFTTILSQEQITAFLSLTQFLSVADICTAFEQAPVVQEDPVRGTLTLAGIPQATIDQLIACLKDAGIVFV